MENNNESDKDYSPDLYYKKLFSHSFLIKELLYLILPKTSFIKGILNVFFDLIHCFVPKTTIT